MCSFNHQGRSEVPPPPQHTIQKRTKMRPESDRSSSSSSLEQSDDTERGSLDANLGRRLSQSLSQLSCSAKSAVSLNQISHVAIRAAHNRAEHQHGPVVTVYVMDVFLQDVLKGLPKSAANRDKHKRTWRQKPEKRSEHVDYQVEHRYSSFRLLRQRILNVVSAPSESDSHPLWCAYCSRVLWLVTAGDFRRRIRARAPWRRTRAGDDYSCTRGSTDWRSSSTSC